MKLIALFFNEVLMLLEKLKQDYKQAFKEKDIVKKDILNYILSQIKNKQIDLQKDLTDEDILKIIQKEIKSRQESISFLEKSGNVDELEIEKQKVEILKSYLPEMLSKEQLKSIVEKFIKENNITDLKKQRGIVIKSIMQSYPGQVDGRLLNEIIQQLI